MVRGAVFPFLNLISKDKVIPKASLATVKEGGKADCCKVPRAGGEILVSPRMWGRRKGTNTGKGETR